MQKRTHQIHGMIDTSSKKITKRVAVACAHVRFTPKTFSAVFAHGSPKGDIFETAKIAGILAAKKTSELIPMCHPLLVNKIHIDVRFDRKARAIEIVAAVSGDGKTGVEMEALTAASISALTVYDMAKWADKGIVIKEIKLLQKTGGDSGDYQRA